MKTECSAVLLAGGQSRRMGRDKTLLEIDGVPLWQRQLATLRALQPNEIFIAGPERDDWRAACDAILPDEITDAGPLAGLAPSLRRCRTPLLVVLAIDLPRMTPEFLRRLLQKSDGRRGVVPENGEHFEPLAAIYPRAALPIAEAQLRDGELAMQDFVRACAAQHLIAPYPVRPADSALFANLNSPNDLSLIR